MHCSTIVPIPVPPVEFHWQEFLYQCTMKNNMNGIQSYRSMSIEEIPMPRSNKIGYAQTAMGISRRRNRTNLDQRCLNDEGSERMNKKQSYFVGSIGMVFLLSGLSILSLGVIAFLTFLVYALLAFAVLLAIASVGFVCYCFYKMLGNE